MTSHYEFKNISNFTAEEGRSPNTSGINGKASFDSELLDHLKEQLEFCLLESLTHSLEESINLKVEQAVEKRMSSTHIKSDLVSYVYEQQFALRKTKEKLVE